MPPKIKTLSYQGRGIWAQEPGEVIEISSKGFIFYVSLPVEKFWAWLRKKLRALDLKDAVSKRPVLGKTAYRERVRRVLKSQKARTVAKNCTLGLRKVCKQVVQSGGIATRG